LKVAALDLGTNSFLCLIAQKGESGEVEVLYDESIITRLGQSVQKKGVLSKEALLRAAQAFSKFQENIKTHDVKKVMAVTTSAARDAENFEELKKVGEEYGIPISVIAGEEEAELSFQGAIPSAERKNSLLLDIGGGSTELAYFDNDDFILKSLPLGSVRLGEMFVEEWTNLDQVSLKKVEDQIIKTLELTFGEQRPPLKNWVAVAGTPTTLKAIQNGEYKAEQIENSLLYKDDVQNLVTKLISLPLIERRKVPGLEAKRADVIPVGAKILETLMNWSAVDKVKVSTKGLRYGLAKRLLSI
jgi:exopolyphosphatase/guanosine-5'-triphosphate,3'-diphosphate pyrophosphatase